MSSKTDIKFALVVILILAGSMFFVYRALHLGPLTHTRLESNLRRQMTRTELGKMLHSPLPTTLNANSPVSTSSYYTLQEPGGLQTSYQFVFDRQGRLTDAYRKEKSASPNMYSMRGLILY